MGTTKENTVTLTESWMAVRPSVDDIMKRAQRKADEMNATVVEVGPIEVGFSRHRTPRFTVAVRYEMSNV